MALSAADADPALADWADTMENAYFTSFPLHEQRAHFALIRRAAAQGGSAAHAEIAQSGAVTEVTVAAADRRGLFADLAGCLAGLGANVVGARVYTSRAGQALDVFHVQAVRGGAFGADNPQMLSKLVGALEGAARGAGQAFEPTRIIDGGRTAAFSVPATVSVDNDASDTATVMEVSGRDRPGLLEALARTLAEARLQLLSAHVDGYGERAVDAFYVCEEAGAKLTDPKRIATLKAALTAVLQADDDASPPRRRLERARASVAR
jgi:[protein-PII] uridylyltransferase